MTKTTFSLAILLSTSAFALSSCGNAATGDSAAASAAPAGSVSSEPFTITEMGTFEEPWAVRFVPGAPVVVVTQKGGKIVGQDIKNERAIFFTGVPEVDYGGQGGLGDIAFLPSEANALLTPRTIFLTWAEAGADNTRGAVLGKGTMVCEEHQTCDIRDLKVIWRQAPKVTGRGHYSHRILISPDEQYIYLASGDRQKLEPAQDNSNTLGTIVRLNMDGAPAAGNPMADRAAPTNQIWSYGHRNILGMDFDAQGRLWEVEHGPAGGDEFNLVKRSANYGWPTRSNGNHYSGGTIPDHTADDGFTKPAITWTPVIAPGDMVIYNGDTFGAWKGDALITGLASKAIVHVKLDGENAQEVARYPMKARIRSITQGPDGALWIVEDGDGGRLLKLTPKS